MKKWQILKAVLYLTLAVFIFVLNKTIMPYVGILVGAIVCLYAAEELAVYAARKTLFSDAYHLFDGIAQLLIGIILFIVSDDIIKVCLVWGVWSILRESKEMAEAIKKLPTRKSEIINVIESVTIIALSFLMILESNEDHAYLHMILLGVELVIVVLFYYIEVFENKFLQRKSKEKDDSEEISI
ncbi:MAG: hypothetical protein IJQ23_04135 [Clostridia bacterium]|nr:hypothetical protein [Clostridia bacterium]